MSGRGSKSAGLGARVWPGLSIALAVVVLFLPGWLLWDQLSNFRLREDDFSFLIDCRSGAEPLANLWEPHNAHVVPVFRLLTAVVARAAGGPGRITVLFGYLTYLSLVLVMLGVGHLVAWETRRLTLGLAAMVLAGVTTVIEPAATWYSAGQTLWAALGVLGTLLALQLGRVRPNRVWPVIAALIALLSPLVWAGGLVAGPSGAAYLLASGDRRARRAAVWPLVGSMAALAIVGAMAGDRIVEAAGAGPSAGWWAPIRGLVYTCQAIVESLILGNLGLDVATTGAQAVVFVAAIGVAWVATRRSARPGPLEAAGATIVVLAYLMAFTLRSGYRFDDLRDLGWYDTMPHVGAVLFALGWWHSARGARVAEPGRWVAMSRGGMLAVAGLAAVLLLLHVPRAEQIIIREMPPMLPSESRRLPVPWLQRLRGVFVMSDEAMRQENALVRLGMVAEIARRSNFSRSAIRGAFGRVEVPGWPEAIRDHDALDLLDLPEHGPPPDALRIVNLLGPLLAPEPTIRPDWLDPSDPWPPPKRPVVEPRAEAGDDREGDEETDDE